MDGKIDEKLEGMETAQSTVAAEAGTPVPGSALSAEGAT